MIDFFWTVGIKRYVFIDCENAENSNAEKVCDFLNEKEYISPDTQIFCLICGDKGNNGWYETFLKKVGKLGIVCNIMPIRIYTVGDNALDNVLSVYLGMVLAHNSNAEFVILAFDHDYNAIKKHFSDVGINIKTEKLKKNNSIEKEREHDTKENTKSISNNDEISKIKDKILKIRKESRPKTKEKFMKHFKKTASKYSKNPIECLNQIFKDFENDGIIRISKSKIEWLK